MMVNTFWKIIMWVLAISFSLQSLKAEDFKIFSVKSCSRSSFRGIFAVSEKEIWISGSGGVLLKSEDKGKSFSRILVPGGNFADFRDLHVLDNRNILLLSIGDGEKSRIFRSNDKGKTWKVAYKNIEPQGFLNSLDFWDNSNGIAVGDPIRGKLDVLITSDSGKTWERISGPEALNGEAGFSASGTCVKTYGKGHAWLVTGGKIKASRVHRTTNRGKTWKTSVTPVLSGKTSAGLFSVIFLTNNRGLVVGGDYIKESSSISTFASTEDGGKTWNNSGDFNPVFQSATGIINVKGKKKFITAGPKGVYITNGREEWEKISDYGYHCLSVSPNGDTVWFAGPKGRIGVMSVNQD